MSRRRATVMCYWGGNIIYNDGCLSYNGNPQHCLNLKQGTTYDELLRTMYTTMQLDSSTSRLQLICRFPTFLGHRMQQYVEFEIKNDDGVAAMLDAVFQNQALNSIDLYVQAEHIQQFPHPIENDYGSYIQLLTQESINLCPTDPALVNSYCGEGSSHYAHGFMADDTFTSEAVPYVPELQCHTDIRTDVIRNLVQSDYDVLASNGMRAVDRADETDDEDEEITLLDAVENINDDDDGDDPSIIVQDTIRMHEPSSTFFINDELPQFSDPNNQTRAMLWDADRPELGIGLIFKGKSELQDAVKIYSINNHVQFQVVESEKKLLALKCKKVHTGCKWRLRACQKKTHGMFQITKYEGPHTCLNVSATEDHVQLDSQFVARQIKELVRADPSLKVLLIIKHIATVYKYDISYRKGWKAKQSALAMIFGDWDESYSVLPNFLAALQKYNQGTIVRWQLANVGDGSAVFDRVFWAFKPCIDGFRHCRPLISIDATFMYGKYKGKLLIATGLDANHQIYPLAFAIVDEESIDTWGWFLWRLREDVVGDRPGICLISDRHQGIIQSVPAHGSGWQTPYAYHRYCLRHIQSNFNSKFHNSHLKRLVWDAGSAHQIRKYDKIMAEIKELNPSAFCWLNQIPKEKWTLAHDGGKRYGVMTTNISEVFNFVLKKARHLPITSCVETIFYKVVQYFNDRRGKASDSGCAFTPIAVERMSYVSIKKAGQNVTTFSRSTGEAYVVTKKGNVQVLNISDRTCSCGKWNTYKMPCSHAMAVFSKRHLDPWQFVDEIYTVAAHDATWATEFHPLQHRDYWDVCTGPTVYPNHNQLRTKGRPQSTRIRNEMDLRQGRSTYQCRLCGQPGHDRRTCPSRIA